MGYAKVILPEDMPKEAGKALRVLEGLGALASVAYATAFLKDRAERQKWQSKIEKQLRAQGKPVGKVNIPENTPIVIMDETNRTDSPAPMLEREKVGSLLTKLAHTRQAIIASASNG